VEHEGYLSHVRASLEDMKPIIRGLEKREELLRDKVEYTAIIAGALRGIFSDGRSSNSRCPAFFCISAAGAAAIAVARSVHASLQQLQQQRVHVFPQQVEKPHQLMACSAWPPAVAGSITSIPQHAPAARERCPLVTSATCAARLLAVSLCRCLALAGARLLRSAPPRGEA